MVFIHGLTSVVFGQESERISKERLGVTFAPSAYESDDDESYEEVDADAYVSSTTAGSIDFSLANGELTLRYVKQSGLSFLAPRHTYGPIPSDLPVFIAHLYRANEEKPFADVMLETVAVDDPTSLTYDLGGDVVQVVIETIPASEEQAADPSLGIGTPRILKSEHGGSSRPLDLKSLEKRKLSLVNMSTNRKQSKPYPILYPKALVALLSAEGEEVRAYYADDAKDDAEARGYISFSLDGDILQVSHLVKKSFGFAADGKFTPDVMQSEPHVILVVGDASIEVDMHDLTLTPHAQYKLPYKTKEIGIICADDEMLAYKYRSTPLVLKNKKRVKKNVPKELPKHLTLLSLRALEHLTPKNDVILTYQHHAGLAASPGAFSFKWHKENILLVSHKAPLQSPGAQIPSFDPDFVFSDGKDTFSVTIPAAAFGSGVVALSVEGVQQGQVLSIGVAKEFDDVYFPKRQDRILPPALAGNCAAALIN